MSAPLGRIVVVEADITALDVDAVVNAANRELMPGGGVCGAIHRAAGPGLARACRALVMAEGACATGEAKLTGAYDMRARFVIHAVGPVWRGGAEGEEAALASAYTHALALARDAGAQSIAFPAISTGIYGFPAARAAAIAVAAVAQFVRENPQPDQVVLCCFDAQSRAVHSQALSALANGC